MTGNLSKTARMPRGIGAARGRNDRGAIIIHVAIAMLGLLAFSAFSIDHGVMMVSRGQAQNSADAGAMAAALYLAYDGGDLPGAQAVGVAAAQANGVWGAQPDITLSDVTFPPCPPGSPGIPDTCVKVDVFRNQRAGGNPLPVFFSGLVGVADQGVRATATAQMVSSSSVTCVLPFSVPDLWQELREDEAGNIPDESPLFHPDDNDTVDPNVANATWDPDDTFDRYDSGNPGVEYPTGPLDYYDAANWGFLLDSHHGLYLNLKAGNPADAINPGHFYPITLVDGEVGGSIYRDNIESCNPAEITLPAVLDVEPGNMIGPTAQGMRAVYNQDPTAVWSNTYNAQTGLWGEISGGCSPNCATPTGLSPRLRPLPLFDPQIYDAGREAGRIDIVLTRFAGFFLDDIVGNNVFGYLSIAPAIAGGGGPLDDASAFLRTVILVR